MEQFYDIFFFDRKSSILHKTFRFYSQQISKYKGHLKK